MTDLVKIDPAEYGLEESKAKQVSDMFKPMLDKMEELEGEYNAIVAMPVNEEAVEAAKALRLKYVKVRTGTATIHKDLKSFYLKGGRFVDGWKNAQLAASDGKEKNLMQIEKHYENIEIEKMKKIQEERASILMGFDIEDPPEYLGQMTDDVWSNYKSGVENNYNLLREAERKAEEERIAKEKADREEQERIRKENEKLKKEQADRDRKEKARIKKEDAERLEREEKERVEQEKRDAEERARLKKEKVAQAKREEEDRKKQEAHDKQLAKEREDREKAEAELNRKKQEEEDRKREEEEAREAELNKGDSDKVNDLINDLSSLRDKYSFKSAKNKKMGTIAAGMITDIIDYVKQEAS